MNRSDKAGVDAEPCRGSVRRERANHTRTKSEKAIKEKAETPTLVDTFPLSVFSIISNRIPLLPIHPVPDTHSPPPSHAFAEDNGRAKSRRNERENTSRQVG